MDIGTDKDVCEVYKTVSCSAGSPLCYPSSKEAADENAAIAKNKTASRINKICELFDKKLPCTLENKQIKRDSECSASGNDIHCDKINRVVSSKFTLRIALRKHQLVHKKTNVADKKKRVRIKRKESTCDICGKRLSSLGHLKRHLLSIHQNMKKYICGICGKRFQQKRNLLIHQITHSDKKNFKCDLCEKSYKHSTALKGHKEREHSNALGIEKSIYFCNECKKQFVFKQTLIMHMLIHDNIKCHVCTICGKGFVLKRYLAYHVKLHTRSEDRQFACTLCPLKFKIKKDLRRHQVKHSEVLNYSCNECGKKFKYKSMLNYHVLNHSNSNRFVCDTCGFSSNNKSTFTIHKRIHDRSHKFPCDLCGKEFYLKSLLERHKAVVHSCETHQCQRCGKTFKAKQYLRNHMKTHSEQPFTCTTCGKTYRSKRILQNHIILKHQTK